MLIVIEDPVWDLALAVVMDQVDLAVAVPVTNVSKYIRV